MEDLVELFRRQEAQRNAGFFQSNVLGKGLLRGFCRVFVADVGVQGGDQHEGIAQIGVHLLLIGGDARHAPLPEGGHGLRQEPGRLEEIVNEECDGTEL